MKCGWTHCKHGGEVDKENAVKKGARYFHPDCLREKDSINEIIKVYHERVDDHPIENFLRKTVNDLVFKDGNSAEFLLFALKYCLDHGWTLRSPNGLRYVAKDGISKKEWEKLLNHNVNNEYREKKRLTMINDEFSLDASSSFTFKPQKAFGFEDILD